MIVAAIRLSERSFAGRYNPNGAPLKVGDLFLVEDPQLREAIGQVAALVNCAEAGGLNAPALPRVLRPANEEEIERWRQLPAREKEAMGLCKDKARELGLDMKITHVRFDDRQRRVIFNFTAEQRVDFRQLVRELASRLQARIELWQIGVRDETRSIDGYGVCGCRLCCSGWIKDFSPVSIRQAKDQDLMLSPQKLSGSCGRLRCCLTYEHEHYKLSAKEIPGPGMLCRCAGIGDAVVVERNLLKREVVVRDAQDRTTRIAADEIEEVLGKASAGALRASAAQGSARGESGGPSSPRERERPARSTTTARASTRDLEDAPASPARPAVGATAQTETEPGAEGASDDKRGRRRGRRRRPRDKQGAAPAEQQGRPQSAGSQDAARGADRPRGPRTPAPAPQEAGENQASGDESRKRRRPRRRRRGGGGALPGQAPPSE